MHQSEGLRRVSRYTAALTRTPECVAAAAATEEPLADFLAVPAQWPRVARGVASVVNLWGEGFDLLVGTGGAVVGEDGGASERVAADGFVRQLETDDDWMTAVRPGVLNVMEQQEG